MRITSSVSQPTPYLLHNNLLCQACPYCVLTVFSQDPSWQAAKYLMSLPLVWQQVRLLHLHRLHPLARPMLCSCTKQWLCTSVSRPHSRRSFDRCKSQLLSTRNEVVVSRTGSSCCLSSRGISSGNVLCAYVSYTLLCNMCITVHVCKQRPIQQPSSPFTASCSSVASQISQQV